MIQHHLNEATLISYASGNLGDALSLVVASHLAVCPECRERLRAATAAGGAVLETAEAAPLAPDSLAHMMARLDAATEKARRGETKDPAATEPAVRDIRLPRPLARRLDVSSLDEIRWRWIAPGVRTHVVGGPQEKGTLRLLKIAPGVAMPEHGHGGNELTLVLSGCYGDETGRYGPGDIADLDEEVEHTPKMQGDEDCICVVATEAPTRFKGVMGRIMQAYLGF